MQSPLSQSLPMEMRVLLFRLSRIWPDLAELESSGVSDILAEWVALIEFSFAALAVGIMLIFLCVQDDLWGFWM